MLNEKSYAALFETYYGALSNFALKYVKDRNTAEDLVQDAFVTIWDKKDTLSIRKNMKSYLFTVVRNNALAYLKGEEQVENIDLLPAEDSIELEKEIDTYQFKIILKKAISELPPKTKEVFKLCKMEGLTRKEASIHLNISEKTIDKQISRAYKILKPIFNKNKNLF